ncbi:thiamine-phosphate kinase [Henriciella sp. AS95]|uniref:thiamine-phosphate kinase n=1 Tax=Henriciella sp. AS95 TaxID=3135782 RepID=UPI003180CC88
MDEFNWIHRYLKPIATSTDAMSLSNDVGRLAQAADTVKIATLDTLAEGTHFLASDPLDSVGCKLVRANVSDILCKGGTPAEAMLSVTMPPDFSESQFQALCNGIGAELERWSISLIGGDTVRSGGLLTLSLMLTGTCGTNGPVTRSGAASGDVIVLSGRIGASYLGLQEALAGTQGAFLDQYRRPQLPGAAWAPLIAEFASASIDISDGLIADAEHLAHESGLAITIDLDAVAWAGAPESTKDILALATGGDDYQALVAIPNANMHAFAQRAGDAGLPFWPIGEAKDSDGLSLHRSSQPVPLPTVKGYTH